jgi:hypothetical protein
LNELGQVEAPTVLNRNQAAATKPIDIKTKATGGAACGPILAKRDFKGTPVLGGGGPGLTGLGSLTTHGFQTR